MLRPALPDLDVSKVILNVIHSHNAPAVDPIEAIGWLAELPEVMPAAEYRNFLLEKIRSAVSKPGGTANRVRYGERARFRAGGALRRAVYASGTTEMYGVTGREDFVGHGERRGFGVDLLFCFDEKGNPTGVILNLACPRR